MTTVDAAATVGLWLAVGLAVYAAVAGAVLFYLPPADRLPSGAVADAAFVVTLPLVLAATWLAAARNRG